MSEIIVRAEKPEEVAQIEAILQAAFGSDAQVNLTKAIRDTAEFQRELSVVADSAGQLLGYALYLQTTVSGRIGDKTATHPAALLAAMGVRPDAQKRGVGERLVRHGLERCRGLGIVLVFTTTLPRYFARIGFQPALPLGLEPEIPVPDTDFQAIDLRGDLLGKLRGMVTFPTVMHP